MLKIAKNGLILHLVGSFGFSRIFFASSPPPPSDFVPVGDRWGPKILSPPPIKNLEKKPCALYVEISDLTPLSTDDKRCILPGGVGYVCVNLNFRQNFP